MLTYASPQSIIELGNNNNILIDELDKDYLTIEGNCTKWCLNRWVIMTQKQGQ